MKNIIDVMMKGAIYRDDRFIAVISDSGASLKLWIRLANLCFPCHRNILDWQKQCKILSFMDFRPQFRGFWGSDQRHSAKSSCVLSQFI